MKKIIIILFLFISLTAIKAQTFISLYTSSTSDFSDFLRKNGLDVINVDDKTIKITTNDQLHFIYLDIKYTSVGLDIIPQYILINIQFAINDEAQEYQIKSVIRKINASKIVKGYHLQGNGWEKENDLRIEYPFWIENGFVGENFVDAIKEFDTFISSKDWITDNIFKSR